MHTGYGASKGPSVGFGNWQNLETKVNLRVDPRIVLQGRLLELSQAELELAVEAEIAENPALARLDESEPVTQEEVLKKIAPQELAPSGDWHEGKRSLSSDDPTSWVELASSQTTLCEHLLASLLSSLPQNLRNAGEWVIHSIDERGYLVATDAEIAHECGCSLEEAVAVIQALQRCDPPGIGAQTLQECLLLQVTGEDAEAELARQILTDGWEDFVAGRVQRMSRRFGAIPALVKRVVSTIKEFNPFPAEGFTTGNGSFEHPYAVIADLVLDRDETGWKVQVKGISELSLGVEPFYRKKMAEYSCHPSSSKGRNVEEAKHVQTFVKKATDFIEGVATRRKTIARIGEYLTNKQVGFLSTGSYTFLRPMTKSLMAKDLSLHESTVSRATADKHVQLPSGEIVSFDVFFKPALRVQKMIEEILATENPFNPLSDEAIAARLAEQGTHVARRTVHKYRDRARLSSSRRRRVA